MQFHELGVEPAIHRALEALGYQSPSPIQEGAIPPALAGRDILGLAQTGTGKTCAFAVPILQYLQKHPQKGQRPPRALIVTPTRELAIQIGDSFDKYGKNLNFIKHTVIFGGVGQHPQVQALRRSVDIITATPGRLLDLHGQGHLDLTGIEILVLDEADRMLDMGFFPDVKRILKLLPHQKQTMLFSATMPKEVSEVANSLLHDPVTVQVDPVSSTVEIIEQHLYFVDKGNKSKLLAHIIKTEQAKNALVFTRTKHGANKVAADLEKAGIPAAAIHGNKSQTARVQALNNFKSGKIRALVATDIAARGIDIDQLTHVFNYNLPEVPETYVHRIGRTGRAGKEGTAISFCDVDERQYLKDIEKLLARKIDVVDGHPFPMMNTTPTPTKNGKRVNPDDEEARQAARERRRLKQEQLNAAKAGGKPQTPATGNRTAKNDAGRKGESAGAPTNNGGRKSRSSTNQPSAKPRNNKPQGKLEDFMPSEPVFQNPRNLPPEPAQQPTGKRRLSNNFTSTPTALEGDKIMDATARLLASATPKTGGQSAKKPAQPASNSAPRKSGAPNSRTANAEAPASNNGRKSAPSNRGESSQNSAPRKGQSPAAPARDQRGKKQASANQPKTSNAGSKSAVNKSAPPKQVVGRPRSNRPMNRPPRAPDMPKSEHSEDFKPFYISFDD